MIFWISPFLSGLIYMKGFYIFVSLTVVLALFSCRGNKPVQDVEELYIQDSIDSTEDTLHLIVEEPEPPQAVDELFDDFFFTFVINPAFQTRRINFPLPCYEGDVQKEIDKDDWVQFNRFSSQDFFSVIYENEDDIAVQKDTAVNRVAVEWIYLQDDYVETYTFRRFKSKWLLMSVNISKIDDVPNGAFLKFYADFVSDSTFQAESIRQPLRYTLADIGEEDSGEPSNSMLTLSDWQSMKAELPIPHESLVNIDYGQPSHSASHKTLLMEGVSNGLSMKFKFRKEDGDWKLTEIEN